MTFTSVPSPEDGNSRPGAPGKAPDWSRSALETIQLDWHPGRGTGLKMPGGYWVTETTLRKAWNSFWRRVSSLDPTKIHSAEDLACTTGWTNRPRGERIAIGRCFKYFAVHGVLPITIANPEAKYNFKYRLNDDLDQAPTLH